MWISRRRSSRTNWNRYAEIGAKCVGEGRCEELTLGCSQAESVWPRSASSWPVCSRWLRLVLEQKPTLRKPLDIRQMHAEVKDRRSQTRIGAHIASSIHQCEAAMQVRIRSRYELGRRCFAPTRQTTLFVSFATKMMRWCRNSRENVRTSLSGN
jgi:hypothetical protein